MSSNDSLVLDEIAAAFNGGIIREALLLATYIRESKCHSDEMLLPTSESCIAAACAWQVANYLEALKEISLTKQMPLTEVLNQSITHCRSVHDDTMKKP